MPSYHQILHVTEDELWTASQEKPLVVKPCPMFYCISRNGHVKFWPELDPVQVKLFCVVEKE